MIYNGFKINKKNIQSYFDLLNSPSIPIFIFNPIFKHLIMLQLQLNFLLLFLNMLRQMPSQSIIILEYFILALFMRTPVLALPHIFMRFLDALNVEDCFFQLLDLFYVAFDFLVLLNERLEFVFLGEFVFKDFAEIVVQKSYFFGGFVVAVDLFLD